ncbi:MAG: hypothetical protein ABFC96_08965 [Thermoguttaceae bacterium]
MNWHLFANPPPKVFFTGLGAGLILVALLVLAFLRCSMQAKSSRRIVLGGLALIAGPVVGAAVAGLMLVFGNVQPLDRVWVLQSLTLVGAVAGALGALTIAALAGNGCDATPKSGEHDGSEQTQRK